jgi:hypothetical protein
LSRIIEVKDSDPSGKKEVEHEQVISGIGADPKSGTFADALTASLGPTRDRVKASPCSAAKAGRAEERRAKAEVNQLLLLNTCAPLNNSRSGFGFVLNSACFGNRI